MSDIINFDKRKEGNVKLIHHSTSSYIEIKVESDKEVKEMEDIESLWLTYEEFDNLKKAITKTIKI